MVRVIDSYFENLREVDLRYVDRCIVGLDAQDTVACNQEELFVSDAYYSSKLCKSFEQCIFKHSCLLYTSPSPRDRQKSRMPSSA